jgi:hypothetical protein
MIECVHRWMSNVVYLIVNYLADFHGGRQVCACLMQSVMLYPWKIDVRVWDMRPIANMFEVRDRCLHSARSQQADTLSEKG